MALEPRRPVRMGTGFELCQAKKCLMICGRTTSATCLPKSLTSVSIARVVQTWSREV